MRHYKDGFIKQDLSPEDFEKAHEQVRSGYPFTPHERLWLDADMNYFMTQVERLPLTVSPTFRTDNGYTHRLTVSRRLEDNSYSLYYSVDPYLPEVDKLRMGYLRTFYNTDRNLVTHELDIMFHTLKRAGLEAAEQYEEESRTFYRLSDTVVAHAALYASRVSPVLRFFKEKEKWAFVAMTEEGALLCYAVADLPTLAVEQAVHHEGSFTIDKLVLDLYDSWHAVYRNDVFHRPVIEIARMDRQWRVRTYDDRHEQYIVQDEMIETDERLSYAAVKMMERRHIEAQRIQEGLEWANKNKLPSSSSGEAENFSSE